jgi:hypothetical protein
MQGIRQLLVLLVICTAPLLPSRAFAQQPAPRATTSAGQDKTSEIDKIFSWATSTAPGCVAAASHRGTIVLNRAYGLADLVSPDGVRPARPVSPASPIVDGLDVNSKAGLFFNEGTGESLAFMSQDEFELTFLSQDQFELKSMEGQTTCRPLPAVTKATS